MKRKKNSRNGKSGSKIKGGRKGKSPKAGKTANKGKSWVAPVVIILILIIGAVVAAYFLGYLPPEEKEKEDQYKFDMKVNKHGIYTLSYSGLFGVEITLTNTGKESISILWLDYEIETDDGSDTDYEYEGNNAPSTIEVGESETWTVLFNAEEGKDYTKIVAKYDDTSDKYEAEAQLVNRVDEQIEKNFQLTIVEHGRYNNPDDYSYDGEYFVNITLKNIGSDKEDVYSTFFTLYATDGIGYSWNGEHGDDPDSLEAGASASWQIFFDMPEGKTPQKLVYDEGDDEDEAIANITLKEPVVEMPTAIFTLKNHADPLMDANDDDSIATITLVEGTIKLSDTSIQLSYDGDSFFDFTVYTLIPNNAPTDEWNTGEAIIVNEADLPSDLTDADGNWPSTDIYVNIKYVPLGKLMYSDHITLEEPVGNIVYTLSTVDAIMADPASFDGQLVKIVDGQVADGIYWKFQLKDQGGNQQIEVYCEFNANRPDTTKIGDIVTVQGEVSQYQTTWQIEIRESTDDKVEITGVAQQTDYQIVTVDNLLANPATYENQFIKLVNVKVSWAKSLSNFTVQDASGGTQHLRGYTQESANRSITLNQSDIVTIQGQFTQYGGEWEVKVRSSTEDYLTVVTPAAYSTITLATLMADPESHLGGLVIIESLEMVDGFNSPVDTAVKFNVTDGTETIMVYVYVNATRPVTIDAGNMVTLKGKVKMVGDHYEIVIHSERPEFVNIV